MCKYIDADKFERDCILDRNCKDMQDVIRKLRDYPNADVVEEKHGKWNVLKDYVTADGKTFILYACSLCGRYVNGNGDYYCPNCDAYMRETD